MRRCEIGDCRTILPTLPEQSFACCVTSPPYWGLRDYGHADQLGLEATPDEYVERMVGVFREVRRVLRDDGTLWLNLGDSYAASGVKLSGRNDANKTTGHGGTFNGGPRTPAGRADVKPKDLVGIPWRVAFALQADGWYLRSEIIWSKPNPMPESVTDRPTKAHEQVFLLAKRARYHFDADAVREQWADDRNGASGARSLPYSVGSGRRDSLGSTDRRGLGVAPASVGRNVRSVWHIATEPYSGSHFAVMPTALVTRCILAGSRLGDVVLDPFFGSGTVGQVAESLGRQWFGCELNPEYGKLIAERTAQMGLAFK